MDTHDKIDGLTEEAVTGAHAMDLATQEKYDANFLRHWSNEDTGRAYCLIEAPTAGAVNQVHKEAHGLVADDIVQVSEGR